MKKILMIAAMMVATVAAKAQFEPGTFTLQPKGWCHSRNDFF